MLGCFLAGLVSISAPCGNVTNEAGILIGVIGTFVFLSSKKLIQKFEVDDGLNQVSIHGACGVWSLLAASIFDADRGLLATGIVSSVLTQLIGVGAIFILAFVPSTVFYLAFKRMSILRISEVVEIVGLDYLECDLTSQNELISSVSDKMFLFDSVRLAKLDRQ